MCVSVKSTLIQGLTASSVDDELEAETKLSAAEHSIGTKLRLTFVTDNVGQVGGMKVI